MKKIALVAIMFLSLVFMISCGGDDDDSCEQNEDCATGFICDQGLGRCIPENGTGDEGKTDDNGGTHDGENPDGGAADGTQNPDEDNQSSGGIYVTCTPGERTECYEGPSGTVGVGICKKGYKECVEDGTDWSECREQVIPQTEICNDGIDQDCDGQDTTPENAIDIDGDGYTYCSGDCCETGWDCTGDPEKVNPSSFEVPENGIDDNCNGQVDEVVSACDTGIAADTTNPVDMAQSIDLCPVTESQTFGVLSAKLLFPDGTGSLEEIQKAQYGVLSTFGNNLLPKAGNSFLAFSTGELGSSSISTMYETSSQPPADWFQANGGQTFPDSPGCSGGGIIGGQTSDPGKPPVNDPIMLELEIRAPKNAEAFGVDVYYISAEFPQYVCEFNDFFVMLLDTAFKSTDPNLQNPADKNIAMDSFGNPLGINLAKSGLFNVCCPRAAYPSCQGDQDLKGTPFTTAGCSTLTITDAHGATGWLNVRGNIVPGEDFKLRMALWDTNDHKLDSMVLLDNFQWYEAAGKPGIAPK